MYRLQLGFGTMKESCTLHPNPRIAEAGSVPPNERDDGLNDWLALVFNSTDRPSGFRPIAQNSVRFQNQE